jgi:site-specific recombinase XerD
MASNIDIHDYRKQLDAAVRKIEESEILPANKEHIMRFKSELFSKDLSLPRIAKYMSTLRLIAEILQKDFLSVEKADIKDLMGEINSRNYSEWTKHDYGVLTRVFFQWLRDMEDGKFPPEVSWIKTNIRKDRCKLPNEGDILSEEEISLAISHATSVRDKAMIAVLYESGCRVGEFGGLRLRDITMEHDRFYLVCQGKTGQRKLTLVSSRAYLSDWLNMHPGGLETPLWINLGRRNHGKAMTHGGIYQTIKRIFKRSGIEKRVTPHLFRHSRATYLAGHLTELKLCKYFGWIPGSKMASVYVHLSGRDIGDDILELNGIIDEKKKSKSHIMPQKCPRCGVQNPSEARFCSKCQQVLDMGHVPSPSPQDKFMSEIMTHPEVIEIVRKVMMGHPDIGRVSHQ